MWLVERKTEMIQPFFFMTDNLDIYFMINKKLGLHISMLNIPVVCQLQEAMKTSFVSNNSEHSCVSSVWRQS